MPNTARPRQNSSVADAGCQAPSRISPLAAIHDPARSATEYIRGLPSCQRAIGSCATVITSVLTKERQADPALAHIGVALGEYREQHLHHRDAGCHQ